MACAVLPIVCQAADGPAWQTAYRQPPPTAGEALDTMHDGVWFAAAMCNAWHATGGYAHLISAPRNGWSIEAGECLVQTSS